MLTVRRVWVCCLAVVLVSMTAGRARGAVADLIAVKDASIFSETGDTANGAGEVVHCGRTSAGNIRRALMQFDLTSIPAGSTVTAVTLTIYIEATSGGRPTETIQLRRITQSWSEGTSGAGSTTGGNGDAATAGDVTWTHRVFSTQTWSTAGGSFSGTTSGSASVSSAAGPRTFSAAGMVTDVQNWLNTPSTNFGWMLVGDESVNQSARRISSRQNSVSGRRPKLTVTYTPPAGTGACCANDGSCTILTNAACTGLSQVYKGDGTVCTPNPCPQPSGACCTAGAACEVRSPTACAGNSGTYAGNDTTCAPNPCLLIAGACCAANAACSVQTYSACVAGGGTYQGYGAGCAGQDCPWVLTPFVDPLPLPTVAVPLSGSPGDVATYRMEMLEIQHQFHSSLPMTTVWGYVGQYPGPTIEAFKDRPVTVTWANELRDTGQPVPPYRTQHVLTVDTCVHGPNVTGVVPYTVVHLHGAHVPPDSDGLPDLAFPPGQQSPPYVYTNNQQAGTLWYHDHALGLTRLNVYMGLAGFYLLRDGAEESLNLPRGENEIPLVIQDRSFKPDGQLDYHTTFVDQFFGDFITVNGKVWPYLSVRQGKYRFRLLNGSNSRTYTLSLKNGGASVPFQQIGTDLGLLPAPV
ncbi:MAG: DNRLRE domain-containing protein, partial [Phycisphaerales bacterium]